MFVIKKMYTLLFIIFWKTVVASCRFSQNTNCALFAVFVTYENIFIEYVPAAIFTHFEFKYLVMHIKHGGVYK